MPRNRLVLLLALIAALPVPASAGLDGDWVLRFADALGEGKDLEIYAAFDDGEPLAAFGLTPKYNKGVHDVSLTKLASGDGKLTGPLRVTINPDKWVPKDGKPVDCAIELAAKLSGDALSGTFSGTRGEQEISGRLTGKPAASASSGKPQRYRLRLYQAMRSLAPARGFKGSNTGYALDQTLMFTLDGDEARAALFENVVPDYRRYSAVVDAISAKRNGPHLRVTAKITTDTGEQGKKSVPRVEQFTYRLKGLCIAGRCVGTYAAGNQRFTDTDVRFWGAVEPLDPPDPGEALAFLRLHDAMRNHWPVLLYLSLSDPDHLHGYAYASGYNHQVHSVDASGLRRRNGKLTGSLHVEIAPDCYRKPEKVTLRYEIDAEIDADDGVVTGTFTGSDNALETAGAVTGELRPLPDPAVPPGKLKQVRLDFGYSLPSGPMPKKSWRGPKPNYSRAVLTMSGGKVTGATVANPHNADSWSAKVSDATLEFDGDRITGRIKYSVGEGGAVKAGAYVFTVQGIVRGGKIAGFWRGTHNGEPILTKSAKLYGELK